MISSCDLSQPGMYSSEVSAVVTGYWKEYKTAPVPGWITWIDVATRTKNTLATLEYENTVESAAAGNDPTNPRSMSNSSRDPFPMPCLSSVPLLPKKLNRSMY